MRTHWATAATIDIHHSSPISDTTTTTMAQRHSDTRESHLLHKRPALGRELVGRQRQELLVRDLYDTTHRTQRQSALTPMKQQPSHSHTSNERLPSTRTESTSPKNPSCVGSGYLPSATEMSASPNDQMSATSNKQARQLSSTRRRLRSTRATTDAPGYE